MTPVAEKMAHDDGNDPVVEGKETQIHQEEEKTLEHSEEEEEEEEEGRRRD